jgi:hypothetical protein
MFGITGTVNYTQFVKQPADYYFGNTCFNKDWKNHLNEYNKRDIYRLLNHPGYILFYNDFLKTYEILSYSDTNNGNIRVSNFSYYAYPQIKDQNLAYNINVFNCEETGVCSFIPFYFNTNTYNPPEFYYDSTSGTFLKNNLRSEFKL